MNFTQASKLLSDNRKIVKGIARKNPSFDGYVIRPKYSKEAKRVLQLNNTYEVTYVASQDDLEANDWYILFN